MKPKLSLRKRVIMKTISPSLVILICGLIRRQEGMLINISLFLAILIFLFLHIYINRRDCEPKDEMTDFNQKKAASLTYTIILSMVGVLMLYALWFKTPVIISMTNLVIIFLSMFILNIAVFLFYDIRGN